MAALSVQNDLYQEPPNYSRSAQDEQAEKAKSEAKFRTCACIAGTFFLVSCIVFAILAGLEKDEATTDQATPTTDQTTPTTEQVTPTTDQATPAADQATTMNGRHKVDIGNGKKLGYILTAIFSGIFGFSCMNMASKNS